MIIFSSRKLEECLAAGGLSNWGKTKYILLPIIFTSLVSQPFIFSPRYTENRPALNLLVSFLSVIANAFVTYFGIKKCFKTNESLDKNAFFERFFVLSVPAFAKVLVISLPATFVGFIYVHNLKDSHSLLPNRYLILLSIIGPIIMWSYYTLVNRSLKRLGHLIQGKSALAPVLTST